MTEEEIIKKAIDEKAVEMYYTASWGERLGVYPDGSISVSQDVGREIAEDERPIALLRCPGIGNLDSDYWTRDWTTRTEDGYHQVNETGEIIDLEECIRRSCRDGDVMNEISDLVDRLIETLD